MPLKTTNLKACPTIGIDIGKNTFHLIGLDKMGAIVLRQKLSRNQVDIRLANMPRCLIGMEACVGAHHLSRQLKALGHDARLMPGALLLERGIAVRQGLRALRTAMPNVLAMTDKLSPRMIHMIEDLSTDWRYLDARIATVSNEIDRDAVARLVGIEGGVVSGVFNLEIIRR